MTNRPKQPPKMPGAGPIDTQPAPAQRPANRPSVRQYDKRTILTVWAAAALPMALLSWLVAPILGRVLGGPTGLPQALILCLTAGLVWQFILVAILVRREIDGWSWAAVRDALWLRSPVSPASGRIGGRVWWAVVVPILAFGLLQFVPGPTPPAIRDLGALLSSPAGTELFAGSWSWFAAVVTMAVFNTVLGEELLFRGLLLPRMRGAFGSGDWLANAILFGCYHLHAPWAIPKSVAAGLAMAYPSVRYRSAWMGIVVHSVQSLIIILGTLSVVAR